MKADLDKADMAGLSEPELVNRLKAILAVNQEEETIKTRWFLTQLCSVQTSSALKSAWKCKFPHFLEITTDRPTERPTYKHDEVS